MTRSLTINRCFALLAFVLFVAVVYQVWRTAEVSTGRFDWIPHVAAAPPWARIGFHMAIAATAAILCAFFAWRAITSIRLYATSHLTAMNARKVVVGSWLARYLPPAPDGAYSLQLHQLNAWRWWGAGTGLFLMTSLPYWLLLWAVGHEVALGPLYIAVQIGHRLPWQFGAAAAMTILAVWLICRHRRAGSRDGSHVGGVDKAAMTILAFIAGSESWTGRQRWRASVIYSLWLQTRVFFPFLTLLTAVPSQRMMLALYCRQVRAGRSPEEAHSVIFTLRITRIITACGFYSVVLVIQLWPVIIW